MTSTTLTTWSGMVLAMIVVTFGLRPLGAMFLQFIETMHFSLIMFSNILQKLL